MVCFCVSSLRRQPRGCTGANTGTQRCSCHQVRGQHGGKQGRGRLVELAPQVLLGSLPEGSNASMSHQKDKITLLRISCLLRSTVTRVLKPELCLNPCSTSGPVKSRIWLCSRLLCTYLLCYSLIFAPLKILSLGISNFMSNYDENNLAGHNDH